MTDNEKELLNIIRHSDNPDVAIEIAMSVILDFLKPRESSQAPSVACPLEST